MFDMQNVLGVPGHLAAIVASKQNPATPARYPAHPWAAERHIAASSPIHLKEKDNPKISEQKVR
jgi:hypothetical protein